MIGQSKKEDLTNHIEKIKEIQKKENNKIINKYANNYIEFIKQKNCRETTYLTATF